MNSVFDTCLLVPGFTRSECASWVQAWGSIAAIVGAFAIAYFQARQQQFAERRRHRAQLRERFMAAAEVIRNLQQFADTLKKRLEASQGVDLPDVVVTFQRGAPNVSALNPLELPGPLASRVAGLQYGISMILARIELGQAAELPRVLQQLSSDCEKAVARAHEFAADCTDLV
jgi:type II secretory pathway component PulF